MSDLFQHQSPLAQIELVEPVGSAPRIEEKPYLGYINLRGRPDHTGFLAGSLKVLGCEPPTTANTLVVSGDLRIYWMGPDEWLVVTPPEQQSRILSDLRSALSGVFSSVVDISSGLTMVYITGERALELLATDCPIDLHVRVFKPGQCAQTRLAKAGMTITPLDGGAGFAVIVRRSFADYLLRWLQDAAIALE